MVDFKNKIRRASTSRPTTPVEIYAHLDRSASAAGPLRPAQEKILKYWYENHFKDKDVIVKLHTGEGKTLVGLLMLQTRLNAGLGPCLYVCPNRQLAEQAARDADKFGIRYQMLGQGDRELQPEFLDGKCILITYVQKVFNGYSIFKLDNRGVPVGTFLMDDSHACMESIRNSFSITIKRSNPAFKRFLDLFRTSLCEQKSGDFTLAYSSETDDPLMLVPYWDWVNKTSEVLQLLLEVAESDDNVKFPLPLLKNILQYCSAYVTGLRIENVPDFMLTDRFTTYSKALSRIMMSATTQDDSFFIKGLGFSKDAVLHPLTASDKPWSGEKMILFPSRIAPDLTDFDVRKYLCREEKSRKYGVVILTPSFRIAEDNYHSMPIAKSFSDIQSFLDYLHKPQCPVPIVFSNRYDGMDLADSMCRILVLDTLPHFESLADRYEQECRQHSNITEIKIAQKIEQGLGRSVRSVMDYSVILILGSDLVRFMRTSRTKSHFSPQTRCQIEIGDEVTDMTKKELGSSTPLNALRETMLQCIDRDDDWRDYYNAQMEERTKDTKPCEPSPDLLDIFCMEYEVEKAIMREEMLSACRRLRKIVESCEDEEERGWYQQKLAKYQFMSKETESAETQYRAHFNNNNLLRSANYQYRSIGKEDTNRLQNISHYLSTFGNYEDLTLFVNELISDLSFGINPNQFERAVDKLGQYLGFETQRPDHESGKGPDNLWFSGANHFYCLECKNAVDTDRTFISKEEAGQMAMHVEWFKKHYPTAERTTFIWIHPSAVLTKSADLTTKAYGITPPRLESLKQQLKKFTMEFRDIDLHNVSTDKISTLLEHYRFTDKDFIITYTEPVRTTDKF